MTTSEPRGPVLPEPLDCAVFAPIGAVAKIVGPDDDASCVERGRHEVDVVLSRVERAMLTAHGTGRLAVAFGVPMLQQRIGARISTIRGERTPGERLEPDVTWPTPAPPDVAPESGTDAAAAVVVDDGSARSVPDASELAIPGYDTLSASQVVERLDGLSAAELAAVRVYETAHRNRRTILGKLDQLVAAD